MKNGNHSKISTDKNGSLLCPICRENFTHLRRWNPIPDDDNRGESLSLRFLCEGGGDGHEFVISFTQHEGLTGVLWLATLSEDDIAHYNSLPPGEKLKAWDSYKRLELAGELEPIDGLMEKPEGVQ